MSTEYWDWKGGNLGGGSYSPRHAPENCAAWPLEKIPPPPADETAIREQRATHYLRVIGVLRAGETPRGSDLQFATEVVKQNDSAELILQDLREHYFGYRYPGDLDKKMEETRNVEIPQQHAPVSGLNLDPSATLAQSQHQGMSGIRTPRWENLVGVQLAERERCANLVRSVILGGLGLDDCLSRIRSGE